jgi:hypothetical protein
MGLGLELVAIDSAKLSLQLSAWQQCLDGEYRWSYVLPQSGQAPKSPFAWVVYLYRFLLWGTNVASGGGLLSTED